MSGDVDSKRMMREEYEMPAVSPVSFSSTLGLFVKSLFVLLSWFATYTGMSHYIIGGSVYGFSFLHLFIMVATASLMLMIVWILSKLFSNVPIAGKLFLTVGYLLLTAVSVGFGFGFYWDLIRSDDEKHREVGRKVADVRQVFVTSSDRFGQVIGNLEAAESLSRERAKKERTRGNSCGTGSAPGRGPIMTHRNKDASALRDWGLKLRRIRSDVRDRVEGIKGEAEKILSLRSTGTSDEDIVSAYREFNTQLGDAIAYFNNLDTGVGFKGIRDDMEKRARQTRFVTPRGNRFTCVDADLARALERTVAALDEIQDIPKLHIEPPTLGNSIKEAVVRLIASVGSIFGVSSEPAAKLGLGDTLPLMLSILVDFCILVLSVPMTRPNPEEDAQRIAGIMRQSSPALTAKMLQGFVKRRGSKTYVVAPSNDPDGMMVQLALGHVCNEKPINEPSRPPEDLVDGAASCRVFEVKSDFLPLLSRALSTGQPFTQTTTTVDSHRKRSDGKRRAPPQIPGGGRRPRSDDSNGQPASGASGGEGSGDQPPP